MTFVQNIVLAFGLLVSFSTNANAECPVLDVNGSLTELQEDIVHYNEQLNTLKNDLIELGEDPTLELADAPKVEDLHDFVLNGCNDLKLFRKTIWFNRGDLRFVDFAKRLVKVEEAKMRLYLDAGKIGKAMNAADLAIEIEELFEIKGSFAGLLFFVIISFLLRKTQEAHLKEVELRKYQMSDRMQCGITRVTYNHRANRLFVKKGKLALLSILVTLLASLICNNASATPKLSVWEGTTTQGKCRKEKLSIFKTNAFTAEAEARAGRPLQAAKLLRTLEVGLYSHCLKGEFKKALSNKIEKAGKLAVGEMIVTKTALLDAKFIQLLFNTGHYLESKTLKTLAKMALSFHIKDKKLGVIKNHVFTRQPKLIKLP